MDNDQDGVNYITSSLDAVSDAYDDLISNEDESVDAVKFDILDLLSSLRERGKYISDYDEREQLSQMARDLGEKLFSVTGDNYPVRLAPFQAELLTQEDESQSQALNLIAQLPLDEIPPVGALPPGSRMPYSPNPLFTGREEELRTLAAHFREEVSDGAVVVTHPIAATGSGGYGKTQLVAAFAHRYGRFFAGGVFWVSMADPNGVTAELAECAASMLNKPIEKIDTPIEQLVQLVQKQWAEPTPRLLIFDNCEDPALLQRWRPTQGGCRILVTSRRSSWAIGQVRAVPLQTFTRTQSMDFLHKFPVEAKEAGMTTSDFSASDDPALDAICHELGDLPLALHVAGSFLTRYRHDISPADYLAQLQQPNLLEQLSPDEQPRWLDDLPTGHDFNIARTFALGYDRLERDDEVDAVALDLLAPSAHFAPGEAIPRWLLLKTMDNEVDAMLKADSLHRLVDLGLIDMEVDGSLTLHRLLAKFVLASSNSDLKVRRSVERVMHREAKRINEEGYPRRLLPLQNHLRYITDEVKEHIDTQAADLCNELGFHLRAIGDLGGARPYYERALAIREETLGPDHPDTALSLNNLGFLLRAMGDLAGARPYYQRALAIYEEALGPDHPDTARSLNNLGALLRAMGDLAGARPYYQRALAIREEALGPDHPDTATSLWWMGIIYQEEGKLTESEECFARAHANFQSALGPDHPNTQGVRANLEALRKEMGGV